MAEHWIGHVECDVRSFRPRDFADQFYTLATSKTCPMFGNSSVASFECYVDIDGIIPKH